MAGYAYTQVQNSNILINNASINNILGGGMASVTINNVYYSVGSAEKPLESPNRVENVTITINDIVMPYTSSTGLLYGGGQGYSYVGNNYITINNGDLSKVYVTAGGSNGYTGNSILEFNDGKLLTYQSVNRGIVDSAIVKVSNGDINSLYLGGETGASDVTGKINNVTISLLNGKINTLDKGQSDSKPLDITSENFTIIKTADITINNDNIPKEKENNVDYDISIYPNSLTLFENESKKISVTLKTTPSGYEDLFINDINMSSSDENIVTISDNLTVLGNSEGNAIIKATLLNKTSESNITVLGSNYTTRLILLFTVLPIIAILCFLIILFV